MKLRWEHTWAQCRSCSRTLDLVPIVSLCSICERWTCHLLCRRHQAQGRMKQRCRWSSMLLPPVAVSISRAVMYCPLSMLEELTEAATNKAKSCRSILKEVTESCFHLLQGQELHNEEGKDETQESCISKTRGKPLHHELSMQELSFCFELLILGNDCVRHGPRKFARPKSLASAFAGRLRFKDLVQHEQKHGLRLAFGNLKIEILGYCSGQEWEMGRSWLVGITRSGS